MRNYRRLLILGAILITVFLVWFFVLGFSSNKPGAFYNKGNNAVWIEHKWVGELSTEAEVQALVNNLKKYQMGTVFVHCGPLKSDGTIDPKTFEYAVNFLEKARKFDDKIEYQAWLGQIRSEIDLSDPFIRHNIAKQAFLLSEFIGFDGIHFDIEPVWDRDTDFIKVLEESRSLMPAEKKISVALAEFIPESVLWLIGDLFKFSNYNSETSYLNSSKYADQIIVMVYDTGINIDWLYRWLVKEETIWLSRLMNKSDIFIAIPSYETKNKGFNPATENVQNGLKGLIMGLNDVRSKTENFAGVAIYPYWEIGDYEWAIYENLWLTND